MALEGTVKLPAFGTVKKTTALWGGLGAGAFVIGAYVWRKRSAASSTAGSSTAAGTTGSAVTDPAGNTCSAVNPATGFCPGTAEDQAALAGSAPTAFDPTGAGSGSGYYYGTGGASPSSPAGPGNFADNAEWAQYAISYLEQNSNADPATVTAALGAYTESQPVTPAQQSIIEEAIAIAGQPPEAGPGGDPPGIKLQQPASPPPSGGGGGGTGGGGPAKVKVPAVTGKRFEAAQDALSAAGLKWATPTRRKPNTAYHVTAQSPKAGTSVSKGATVHLTIKEGA